MSEGVKTSDTMQGADVVYRKFLDLYNNELKDIKLNRPREYISTVAEWAPAILNYFDESFNASLSIHILQDVLNESLGDKIKSNAVIAGLYNASLRVSKKKFSEETHEYYKYFFESREIIYEEKQKKFSMWAMMPLLSFGITMVAYKQRML